MGGLEGTEDTDSLDCDDDGGFGDGHDGGAENFESTKKK